MQDLIPTLNYYDESVFEIEIEKIFKSNWLFGCMKDAIPNKNDYVTVELHKHSVILYNNGTEIVALQNVCPHRFNRIFNNNKGNGPLICKFHSWSFDGYGKLRNTNLLAPENNIEHFCLVQYPVEIIGKFIFFNFNKLPKKSLREQYGKYIDHLDEISNIIDKKIHYEEINHNVNWKIICENVIEISHCQSLHKETLVKIGYCAKPVEEFSRDGNNSFMTLLPVESSDRKKRDQFINKNLPREVQKNSYKHTLFFPNFTIGIYEGLNISVGLISPIDSKRSIYRLIYYTAKIKTHSATADFILDSMKEDTINFGREVFFEDKIIIEQVQKGVEEATHKGLVYESDKRVLWFMESYLRLMRNN
jgi:phenylpropionate dioxygenase-like ring-hydroxylating dioxygenase large terminal subunit